MLIFGVIVHQSIDEVLEWVWEHAIWVYVPDSKLDRSSSKGLPPPPNWRRRFIEPNTQARWRICLQALMKERLGPVAGESQPFKNPITGKHCKACVLTWKCTNTLWRVHRFRSYSMGGSDIEGSADERDCPIWKVAWIAVHEPLEHALQQVNLGNDHEHSYRAITRGHVNLDKEAYDEMVHIWKSVDDSCFVSIESMRKEDYSDKYPVVFAALRSFDQFITYASPETCLPKTVTLHGFEFKDPVQIKSDMWKAWNQVLKEFDESKPKPAKHTKRIVDCAVRLLGATCSNRGMCWTPPIFRNARPKQTKGGFSSVVPMHSNASSIRYPQGEKRGATPKVASADGIKHGTGALYDVTTNNHRTISTG